MHACLTRGILGSSEQVLYFEKNEVMWFHFTKFIVIREVEWDGVALVENSKFYKIYWIMFLFGYSKIT